MLRENIRRDNARTVPPQREPISNVPTVVLVYVALMALVHLVRVYFLTDMQDDWLLDHFGFIATNYALLFDQQNLVSDLLAPITYSFLHGSWLHLIFNSFWLLVFSSSLAARLGALRFTILWFTSAAFSAFSFMAISSLLAAWGYGPGDGGALIGASGVVAAMVGAACRFMVSLRTARERRAAPFAPRLGIFEALGRRYVVVFILIWVIPNLVLAGMQATEVNVAWQGHVGGFLFGYLAFALFDPPLRRR